MTTRTQFMTLEAAADALEIPLSVLKRHVRDGTLQTYRISGSTRMVRVRAADVDALANIDERVTLVRAATRLSVSANTVYDAIRGADIAAVDVDAAGQPTFLWRDIEHLALPVRHRRHDRTGAPHSAEEATG